MIKGLPLKILHGYGLLSLIIFLIVQSLKHFKIPAPKWIFYYLNDFLVIPMVAIVCLHGVWLIKKDRTLRLDGFSIFSLAGMYSIYFEYLLPQQSSCYTGDIVDVACYFLGGLVFLGLQRLQ